MPDFYHWGDSSKVSRGPGSYAPSDDLSPIPLKRESFASRIWVEDSAGILKSMQRDFERWEMVDEYARNYNLESTGLYSTPDSKARGRYVKKKIVKYLDRRLAGEMKKAEKGSALHRAKKFQQALRPTTEARVSKRVRIKFKARLLEGRAIARIENPWVKTEVSSKVGGGTQVRAIRKIETFDLNSSINYQIDQGQWEVALDRSLSPDLRARVSSGQSEREMAFGPLSDQKAELMFYRGL